MSLQNDFERCLEYAQALEIKQQEKLQAQNNIISVGTESERLKKKVSICLLVSALSAVFALFLLSRSASDSIPPLILCIVTFIVSLCIGIKARKDSIELESQKSVLIQQYTTDAERCDQEMSNLIDEIHWENLLDIVPADYFYSAAIEFCLSQIRKKLANTATEAFRQLEAEIKRLEQMEQLEQMHFAEMEQLSSIKRSIDINTLATLMEQENNRSQY